VRQALRQLLEDFLSAIVFFAVYALTGSLAIGVGLAIAVGLAQVARRKLAGQPVDPMQWMSLALVIVLGSATILFHTPRLMMIKPSIAHLSIAAVMLRRGWMSRYLPPIAREHLGAPIVDAAGYAWAALIAALGVANLVIALECSVATWAWFISFGAIGAKLVAFALQYVVFRAIIIRRIAAAALLARADGGAAPYHRMIAESAEQRA
jgi:intracellular septation protein